MKNKFPVVAVLIAACVFTFASRAAAQQSSVNFGKTGISVNFKVQTSAPEEVKKSFGDSVYFTSYDETETGGRVHRVLSDTYLGSYFGYDFIVEPTAAAAQGAPAKYKVSIKPLSIVPPKELHLSDLTARQLPKYPADMTVEDGDTIALDVLVNSQTRVKIVDLIKVTTKKPQSSEFTYSASGDNASGFGTASGSPNSLTEGKNLPEFSLNDVKMRLTSTKLLVGGAESSIAGGAWGGTIEGSILSLYLPEKGRFIFSLARRDNFDFEQNAVIDGNKIVFQANGEKYEIVSNASILPSGGSYKIWMLNDAAYRPAFASTAKGGQAEYGAADSVEYLLARKARARRKPSQTTQNAREQIGVYQKWIEEDVFYLASDAEKQDFSQLGGNAEREQFIESFWKRRDATPETAENEFRREYYGRIAYANQNFAFANTPGWKTDRGRIFITYGKPDQLQKSAAGETWIYNSLPGLGNNIKFEYVATEEKGNYRLHQ